MTGSLYQLIAQAVASPGHFVDVHASESAEDHQSRAVAKALEMELADRSQERMDQPWSLQEHVDGLLESEQGYNPAIDTLRALCWDLRGPR